MRKERDGNPSTRWAPRGQEVRQTCFFFFEDSAAVATMGLELDCCEEDLLSQVEDVGVQSELRLWQELACGMGRIVPAGGSDLLVRSNPSRFLWV